MKTTCGIFFINCKNQLLIGHPTSANANTFSIPKGIMDDGETPLQAALREFKEETSIDLLTDEFKDCLFIDLGTAQYKTGKKILHAFLCISNDINHLNLIPRCNSVFVDKKGKNIQEINYFRWVEISEIGSLIHESQQVILEKIKILNQL